MPYAAETDVYENIGISKEAIQRMTDKTADEVKTMIESFITDAERDVKDLLHIPHVCALERHLGTGEDDEFQLGQEDVLFYMDIDVTNCVEMIRTCWFEGKRKILPYPRDCEMGTESSALWDTVGYTTPTDDATNKMAGTKSIKFDWSTSIGTGCYPKISTGVYIDKNIDIYSFMFLRLRASVVNTKVTIRLYDEAGNFNEASYTCVKANKWYLVMLDLDEDFSGNIDWDDDPLQWLTVTVDKQCVLNVDNINFNDEWCFTAPSGKLVIMRRADDQPSPVGYEFLVTYTYDPFKVTIPKNIKDATALIAGAKVIDHLIGIRQSMVVFEADTLLPIPDKESLYATKGSLLAKAKEKLGEYGFGWSGTPVE